jgi:hypothetical protein
MKKLLPALLLLAACQSETRVDAAKPPASLQPVARSTMDTAAAPSAVSLDSTGSDSVIQAAASPVTPAPSVAEAPTVDTVLVDGAVLDDPSVPWNKYPRLRPNDCAGEACDIRFPAVACAEVQLRSAPSDNAPLDIVVPRNDTVLVTQTDMRLESPGVVVFRKAWTYDRVDTDDGLLPGSDTVHFAAGDTIYLLRYYGLGNWEAAVHGKRRAISGWFWFSEDMLGTFNSDSSIAVGRSSPKVSTWWHVSVKDGRRGFWKFDSDGWRTGLKPDAKYWEGDCNGNST